MLSHMKILVSGIVQGVGFRPFCARLAAALELPGSVRNTSSGVEVEVTGENQKLDAFLERLESEPPPASFITSVRILSREPASLPETRKFSILGSRKEENQLVLIPPDLALCSDCLSDMRDAGDRRYRYPFINCTNCGPRYTIIRELPYDRPKTTMAPFPMCPDCAGEYGDQENRRFHAQPNACPACGPKVWLTDGKGTVMDSGDGAVRRCSSLLDEGRIVAIKGIGGFHIACTPFRDDVVSLLRSRKGRRDKPFAVMASSMETARELVYMPRIGEKLLLSPQSPIVICCRRRDSGISRHVAPGQKTLGVILPYSPLHHLVMEGKRALIMTSANFSDAPIVSDNENALSSLGGIADYFLLSNRDIHMPIDDSVAVPTGRTFFLIRRARGYTPLPLPLPREGPVILGAGGEMKSTFCFSRGGLAFPGQYLGDMKQRGTAAYYGRAISHLLSLYRLQPEHLAYDLHPQYISTRTAMNRVGTLSGKTFGVQHHHAHLAACLLENGFQGEAIGVILDGTGYGEDGSIWGGEFLVGNGKGYQRAGHFLQSRLPGGDAAVHEPWRYALGLLKDIFGEEEALRKGKLLWPKRAHLFSDVLRVLPFSPATTSCGRLFDGIAALLGLSETVSYDGQAAMGLEGIAQGTLQAPFGVVREGRSVVLDWRPAVKWVLESKGILPDSAIAGGFHGGMSRGILEACLALRSEWGLNTVALSGGVWQNRRLLATTVKLLRDGEFSPLVQRLLPPNDECVSAGQVAVASELFASSPK